MVAALVVVLVELTWASVLDLSSAGCVGAGGSLPVVTDDELSLCGCCGLVWSSRLSSLLVLPLHLLVSVALCVGLVLVFAAAAADPPVPPSSLLSGEEGEAAAAEPESGPVLSRSGMATYLNLGACL